MSIELQSQPGPGQQCRKSHDKEPNGVGRYRAVDPQPQTAHGEYRDSNRLEDRPLLVLGPTAKAAPDGRENARKTGEAAENAVQKAHASIRRDAASLDGLHRRSGEAIRAVEHEHHAHGDADVVRTGPSENRHPKGTPKAAPNRNGHSRLQRSACRNFQTETPCTTSPKAMINVAVCIGVRMCSQTPAAINPNANPATPVTSAAANVAVR